MTKYGLSDPWSLRKATDLSFRAVIGYSLVMLITMVMGGDDARYAVVHVYAMVYSNIFFGMALLTIGKRRMLEVVKTTGTISRIFTMGLLALGTILIFNYVVMLVALTSVLIGGTDQ